MNNLIKNEKTVDKIFLGLAVLCISLILILSVNSFYYADDYCFKLQSENGIIANCLNGYYNWDGRFLTLGGVVQGYAIKFIPVEILTLLWSLCFLFSGYLVYSIVVVDLKLIKNNKYLLALLFAIILWSGSFFHISETVYWATGGVYSFHLLLGSIWIFAFLNFQKNKFSKTKQLLFVLISFFMGASTQNLSVGLLTLVILTTLISFLQNNNTKITFNISIILQLIIGILFISFAPGNFKRMQEVPKIITDDFIGYTIIKNFIIIFIKYSFASSVLCVLSVLITVSFVLLANPSKILKLEIIFYKIKSSANLLFILKNSKWFLVALSTIVPFLFIPQFVSKRTSIYFLYFIMLFVVTITFKVFNNYSKPADNFMLIKRNILFSKSIFVAFFCCNLIFISYTFYYSSGLKNEITFREKILRNGKDKTLYIKEIEPKWNTILFKNNNYNIKNNTEQRFIIENMQSYFKTKVIIVK